MSNVKVQSSNEVQIPKHKFWTIGNSFDIWILIFGFLVHQSIFLEPIPDFFSPDLYPIVVSRITLFEVLQKTLNHSASRWKDGQTNHEEENPLEERKEEAKDPQSDEDPTDDQHSNFLKSLHFINLFPKTNPKCLYATNISLIDKIKQNLTLIEVPLNLTQNQNMNICNTLTL